MHLGALLDLLAKVTLRSDAESLAPAITMLARVPEAAEKRSMHVVAELAARTVEVGWG